ncbi:MAG: hypothetical protein ABIV47_11080, partial [Roseiflexaceae bacterium]
MNTLVTWAIIDITHLLDAFVVFLMGILWPAAGLKIDFVKVDTVSQSKSKPKTADLRYNRAATYAAPSYEPLDGNRAYWITNIPRVSGVRSGYCMKRPDEG